MSCQRAATWRERHRVAGVCCLPVLVAGESARWRQPEPSYARQRLRGGAALENHRLAGARANELVLAADKAALLLLLLVSFVLSILLAAAALLEPPELDCWFSPR